MGGVNKSWVVWGSRGRYFIRKGGGVWVTEIRCFRVHMHNVFSPLYEVRGSPIGGGGGSDPQDPLPMDPPLGSCR